MNNEEGRARKGGGGDLPLDALWLQRKKHNQQRSRLADRIGILEFSLWTENLSAYDEQHILEQIIGLKQQYSDIWYRYIQS